MSHFVEFDLPHGRASFEVWEADDGSRAISVWISNPGHFTWTWTTEYTCLPADAEEAAKMLAQGYWRENTDVLRQQGYIQLRMRPPTPEYRVALDGEPALTREQWEIALKLADVHGHEWASAWRYHKPLFPLPIEAIREYTVSLRGDGWLPGLSAPALDDYGNVVHQTATGRTHWSVTPAGSATIEIHRPTGCVLAAIVLGNTVEIWRNPSIACHERHVGVLEGNVRILVPDWRPGTELFGEIVPRRGTDR